MKRKIQAAFTVSRAFLDDARGDIESRIDAELMQAIYEKMDALRYFSGAFITMPEKKTVSAGDEFLFGRETRLMSVVAEMHVSEKWRRPKRPVSWIRG